MRDARPGLGDGRLRSPPPRLASDQDVAATRPSTLASVSVIRTVQKPPQSVTDDSGDAVSRPRIRPPPRSSWDVREAPPGTCAAPRPGAGPQGTAGGPVALGLLGGPLGPPATRLRAAGSGGAAPRACRSRSRRGSE